MSISILGAGRMGTTVAYALSKLGHRISLIDNSAESLTLAQRTLNKLWEQGEILKVDHILGDVTDTTPSTVISCLPYHQNFELAKYCIDNRIAYCDLGGSVEVENQIKEYATNAKKSVMLSLGLAPGLINILVESLIKKHGVPESVFMYVGGLPQNNTWYDNKDYCCNWSVDGLLNEYKAPVEILSNGQLEIHNALEGYEEEDNFEAFFTSGGISHTLVDLQKKGVKNCSYRTLRYRGHLAKLKTLLDSGLTDEEVKKCLSNLYPFNPNDQVLIRIKFLSRENGGNLKINFSQIILSDMRFTAMARSTAFSAASVVDLVENKWIVPRNNNLISYRDIPLHRFFENLTKLGL